jgi:ankyrin repeat protein
MKKQITTLCLLIFLTGCGAVEVKSGPAQAVEPIEKLVLVEEVDNAQEKARKQKEDARRRELDRIAQLIELLGHEKWRVRDKATREIFLIGKPALPLLAEAVKSGDLEVKVRAEGITKAIRYRLESAHRDFFVAVKNGNLQVVKQLAEQYLVDLQLRYQKDYTYLHIAAEEGHTGIAAYLIDKGITVSVKDVNGMTPLYLVSDKKTAELLIAKGANVNERMHNGNTPLHYVSSYGRVEIVKILLANGADFTVLNKDSATALHLAAGNGDAKICEMLIESGAEINSKNSCNETPFDMARQCGHSELESWFRNHGGESGQDAVNLEYAAETEDIEKMKEYTARGVDLSMKMSSGRTLLHWAAMLNQEKVVRYLLGENVNVNATDDVKETPLHCATGIGNMEIAVLLVKAGAELEAKNYFGRTPLHEAAYWAQGEMVEFLLKKGANINAGDRDGLTPLDCMIGEDEDMVELLRKHSAKTREELESGGK